MADFAVGRPCATRSPGSCLGFTLLELLVVIALIGILASLLVPAVAAAKRRTRTTHCANNLRQLGIALQLYVDDERFFPLATSGDGLGNWQRTLRPASGQKVFHCPQLAQSSEEFMALFKPPSEQIFPHYGYNYLGAARRNPPPFNLGLGGDFRPADRRFLPAPENRVVAPSEMIAIGDSPAFIYVNLDQPPPDPGDVLYLAFPHIVPQFNYPGVGNWHNDSANIVFCDGHTESAKQSVWIQASPERRRLWNNDHQPHEETW
ncbi:MAG: type II secretion system protein [Verrucomicrobiota bacterium]